MVVIGKLKKFYFNFDWPKDVDKNFKYEIKFVMKSNISLAENKLKNDIEQSLSKYKHGNDIHKYRKQQNEETTYIYS